MEQNQFQTYPKFLSLSISLDLISLIQACALHSLSLRIYYTHIYIYNSNHTKFKYKNAFTSLGRMILQKYEDYILDCRGLCSCKALRLLFSCWFLWVHISCLCIISDDMVFKALSNMLLPDCRKYMRQLYLSFTDGRRQGQRSGVKLYSTA